MSLAVDARATFEAAGDEFTVDVDLSVADGETLVVLGPSGSGKTLVLETAAGFHDHDGHVSVDSRDVTGRPPEDRDLGVVFQEYALFPHMTARENVAFGRRYHDDARDPDRLLASLDVADLADRRPRTLSGGERQRVALARALAIRPRAFLLDEPLSALDAPTRQRLRSDLADLLADETALYVTHDRTTARALADRVAVLRAGRVVQVDDADAVFEQPNSPFVARFTGANCLPLGDLPDRLVPTTPGHASDATHLAVRPEHVRLPSGDDARVRRVVREDAAHRVTLNLGGTTVDALARDPPRADRVGVEFPPEHVTLLSGDGE